MVSRLLPPEYSGAGRQAALQARALAATGEAEVTLLGSDEAAWLPKTTRDGNLTVRRVPVRRRGTRTERLLFACGVLVEALHTRYDVVHVHGNAAVLAFLRVAKPVRRTRLVFKPTMVGKDDAETIAHRSEARARSVDVWLCTSKALADRCVRAAVPPQKIARVANAVDAAPPSAQIPRERETWVSVGAIQQRKRQHLLVRAWALLAEPRPALWLVGPVVDPLYADSVRRLVIELGLAGDIRLLGPREDVPELLAAGSGFALASSQEGMPNAALEALAAGLPVVLTRFEGADDVASLAPERVRLVEANAHALAQAIAQVDRHRCIPAGMRMIAPAAVAHSLLGIYRATSVSGFEVVHA